MGLTDNIKRDAFYGYIAAENTVEIVKAISADESLIPLFLKYTESHGEWGRAHDPFIDTVISKIKLETVSRPVADQVHAFAKRFWSIHYQKLSKTDAPGIFDTCLRLCRESHVSVVKNFISEHKKNLNFFEYTKKAVENDCMPLAEIVIELNPRPHSHFAWHDNFIMRHAIETGNIKELELFSRLWPEPHRTKSLTNTLTWAVAYEKGNFSIIKGIYEALPNEHTKNTFLNKALANYLKSNSHEDFKAFLTLLPIEKRLEFFKEKLILFHPDKVELLIASLGDNVYEPPYAHKMLSLLIESPHNQLTLKFVDDCPPQQRTALLTTRASRGFNASEQALLSKTPIFFKQIIDKTPNPNLHFAEGSLLLHATEGARDKIAVVFELCPAPLIHNLLLSKDDQHKSALYNILNNKEAVRSILQNISLVEREALYAPATDGSTPLHHCTGKDRDVASLILQYCPPSMKPGMFHSTNKRLSQPLTNAIAAEDIHLIQLLCSHYPQELQAEMDEELFGSMPSAISDLDTAQTVFHLGTPRIDFFQPYDDGRTLLSQAAEENAPALEWVIEQAGMQNKLNLFEEIDDKSLFARLMSNFEEATEKQDSEKHIATAIFSLQGPFTEEFKKQFLTEFGQYEKELSRILLHSARLNRGEARNSAIFPLLFQNGHFLQNALRKAKTKEAFQTLFKHCPEDKLNEMLFNRDERGLTPVFDTVAHADEDAIQYYFEHVSSEQEDLLLPLGKDILSHAHKQNLHNLPAVVKYAPPKLLAQLESYDYTEIFTTADLNRLIASMPDPLPKAFESHLLVIIKHQCATFVQLISQGRFNDAILPVLRNAKIKAEFLLHKNFREKIVRSLNTPAELEALLKDCDDKQKRQILLNRADTLKRSPIHDIIENRSPAYLKYYLKQALPLDISILFDEYKIGHNYWWLLSDAMPIEHAFLRNETEAVQAIIEACPPSSKDALFAALDFKGLMLKDKPAPLQVLLEKASEPQRIRLYTNLTADILRSAVDTAPGNVVLLLQYAPKEFRIEMFAHSFNDLFKTDTQQLGLFLAAIPTSYREEYAPLLEKATADFTDILEKVILTESNPIHLARLLNEPSIFNALMARTSFTEIAFRRDDLARIIMEENQELVKKLIIEKGGFNQLIQEERLAFLPLHEPSQIKLTISKVHEDVKTAALLAEVQLEQREKEINSAQGFSLAPAGAEQILPIGNAIQVMADETVSQIPWETSSNVMQEQAKRFIKKIPLQTLAYAAAQPNLQQTVALYLRLFNEMELAVVIPQLSTTTLVSTLMAFPSLDTQIAYLHFAHRNQRLAFLSQWNLREKHLPNWEERKAYFEKANEHPNPQVVVDEFFEFSKKLTLLDVPIQQIKRLQHTLSAQETTPNFLNKIKQDTQKAINRLESIKQDLPKLRTQILALQPPPKTGDTPQEFLDPFTGEIMWNPVILPGMGEDRTVVDETSIKVREPNSWQNPYNRQYYPPDAYQPNVELKAKLSVWLQQQSRGSRGSSSLPQTP